MRATLLLLACSVFGCGRGLIATEDTGDAHSADDDNAPSASSATPSSAQATGTAVEPVDSHVTHWCCYDSNRPQPSSCEAQSTPCYFNGVDTFDLETTSAGGRVKISGSPVPNLGVCPWYNLSGPGGNQAVGGAPSCWQFAGVSPPEVVKVTVSSQQPFRQAYTWNLCWGGPPCSSGRTLDSFGECCGTAHDPTSYATNPADPPGVVYAQFSTTLIPGLTTE
jgi:hypothetical protein